MRETEPSLAPALAPADKIAVEFVTSNVEKEK